MIIRYFVKYMTLEIVAHRDAKSFGNLGKAGTTFGPSAAAPQSAKERCFANCLPRHAHGLLPPALSVAGPLKANSCKPFTGASGNGNGLKGLGIHTAEVFAHHHSPLRRSYASVRKERFLHRHRGEVRIYRIFGT
jgi:hypothetical protein